MAAGQEARRGGRAAVPGAHHRPMVPPGRSAPSGYCGGGAGPAPRSSAGRRAGSSVCIRVRRRRGPPPALSMSRRPPHARRAAWSGARSAPLRVSRPGAGRALLAPAAGLPDSAGSPETRGLGCVLVCFFLLGSRCVRSTHHRAAVGPREPALPAPGSATHPRGPGPEPEAARKDGTAGWEGDFGWKLLLA